jgi:putative flippase GtrA
MNRQSVTIFIKSQVSSIVSTLVDFSITILLKEVVGIWYLFSTSTGSILGGVTNFFLGRKWVFNATGTSSKSQAVRYVIVWGGSILLNITSVFFLTSFGHLNYLLSKIITAVMVGIFFNYILQKKYVFSFNRESQKTTTI